MVDIPVIKVSSSDDRSLPVFEQAAELVERIRERAFGFFSQRGFVSDHALDDWLAAESEICWPTAKLVEFDKSYDAEIALPGYEAGQIEVTVTPHELLVHANVQDKDVNKERKVVSIWSEFGCDDVYRRVELHKDIDVSRVTATLHNGMLKVAMPKADAIPRKVPVASAA